MARAKLLIDPLGIGAVAQDITGGSEVLFVVKPGDLFDLGAKDCRIGVQVFIFELLNSSLKDVESLEKSVLSATN